MSKTIAQVEVEPSRVVFALRLAVSPINQAIFARSRATAETGRAIVELS